MNFLHSLLKRNMKQILLAILPFSLFAASCTSNGNDTTTGNEQQDIKTGDYCYQYNNGKDSVKISFRIDGKQVEGMLSYNYFEKDKSHGAIKGEMHGDTLIADYDFDAEGVHSVRQVAFLKMDNVLHEGYGPMEERDGKFIFTNMDSVAFISSVPMEQTDCGK